MKLRFHLILAALLFLGTGAVWAGDKALTIAVFDLTATDRAMKSLAPKISALVMANLSTNENFIMLERVQLSKALSEQALGLSGSVSAEAAAEVGHLTGAKILVSGYLIKHGQNQMMMVANIIGAETSRLYTEIYEVHYPTDAPQFAANMSQRIATNILHNATNLVLKLESRDDQIKRILASVKGAKRPVVLVSVAEASVGATNADLGVNIELGMILQKAGFTVVDEKSDQKPDVLITGVSDYDCSGKGTDLFSCRATVAVKVQDRATGRIIAFDRQESAAMDLGRQTSGKRALENAADELAARLVPLLAE